MATRGDPAEAGDRTVVEMPNLQSIKTKKMRVKAFIEMKQMKRKLKMAKKRSVKEAIKKGEKVLKQLPQTIESLRIPDETMVNKDDEEIMLDEATDELAAHFQRQTSPKILITTSYKHHMRTKLFCKELEKCLPSAEYYHRKGLKLKRIIPQAVSRDFTDLIIINEDQKTPNAFLLIHLPNGPTAHFKLTSVCLCKEIKKVGELTGHRPELILNNFNTRLGHTVGRVLASLFPLDPQFIGRRVITFHNQRDFIFFRHHRYVFRNEKRVGLQELGPRFTLKLRSLQKGTFDSKYGEYEWVHKRHEMETSRRKFFL